MSRCLSRQVNYFDLFGSHSFSANDDILEMKDFLICHWSNGCGVIMNLVLPVTSQDNVINGSFELIGGSSSRYITNLSILVTLSRHCNKEICF